MSQAPLDRLRVALSDRYRIERVLGSGGMATVYLAYDLKHNRPVAIKVLRADLAAILGKERFLREIEIVAGLNHPHILPLHDSGVAGDLLYYVMPYIEGESLMERIHREKQLPVDEAVRITREIAGALGFAHANGLVHRDIKPGNILLSSGFALVADFGLARAVHSTRDGITITMSGLTIGTPAYMSPEQASGDDELDGRSDIYSLACVLYEMLAGDPPFTASKPQAVLARHATAQVTPLRVIRPEVPVEIERAVLRGLAKSPADRFSSAEDFAGALDPAGRARAGRRLVTRLLIGAIALVAILLLVVFSRPSSGPVEAITAADTSHYAVLGFEGTAELAGLPIEQMIHDALARWRGISLVDRFQIADMRARMGPNPLTPRQTMTLARQLGAGRFIRGDVTAGSDSARVHAVLYDASRGVMLFESTVRVAKQAGPSDSSIVRLVDQLLFRGSAPHGAEGGVGSTSFPARLAFSRGQAAINGWDLERADSAFAMAFEVDPDYAQSALWLALVRSWNGLATSQWRYAAEQVAARKPLLSQRDQLLADAVLAQSRGDYGAACPVWRRVTVAQPNDFAGWYGLAVCARSDPLVQRDPRSPSGWRFRASYHEAVRAYQRAFELLPSIHRALRSGSFARVQDLLFTSANRLRSGRAQPPDTILFFAYQGWHGDTLEFIPFPATEFASGSARIVPTTRREAVVRQRQLFRDIATAWATAFPLSADAQEALAVSLELLGDPSALEVLHRARGLAQTSAERLRVASAEVWLRLKLSLPDDRAGLLAVRALGDSLLEQAGSPDGDPDQMGAVAALLGRCALAASLSGRALEQSNPEVPRSLARTLQALVSYATFGGPADTLIEFERRVLSTIPSALTAAETQAVRRDWLERAATLSFPDVILRSFQEGTGSSNSLLQVQRAAHQRKTEEVRAAFEAFRNERQNLAPEDLTLDALYGEARVLAMIGDDSSAAAWLDPTLGAIRLAAPQTLALVTGAGTLVKAMAFRAELGLRLKDPAAAARWAGPVAVLWNKSDPFLQPLVRRMEQLSR